MLEAIGTFDIIGATIASVLRLALTACFAFALVRFGTIMNQTERFGLGLAGGSSFLTLAVIWDIRGEGTPFDIWAGVLLSLGLLIYFAGRMLRMFGHEIRNTEQKRVAHEHFARKAERVRQQTGDPV